MALLNNNFHFWMCLPQSITVRLIIGCLKRVNTMSWCEMQPNANGTVYWEQDNKYWALTPSNYTHSTTFDNRVVAKRKHLPYEWQIQQENNDSSEAVTCARVAIKHPDHYTTRLNVAWRDRTWLVTVIIINGPMASSIAQKCIFWRTT